ncbi:MAG: hypothetical protein CM1200mP2_09870 [Planctomycetaceae bacterium]|nr:MAG: hypothetical protein CM1200mP2_09870 [Planctomycetaceae bacterium]
MLVPVYGIRGAALALVVAKLPFVIASLVIVFRETRSRITEVEVVDMCGFAGLQRLDTEQAKCLDGGTMAESLAHRGPDAAGMDVS